MTKIETIQTNLDFNPFMFKKGSLKAIDLFAGIGGIRLGFQEAFGKNIEFVFSSEIDKYAKQTYYANFGEVPYDDITKIDEKDIPPHDIILAGFPCQAFSVAGKRLGFEDTRGTLFFDVARIATYHKPKLIFLENVKGFLNHDKGNTFKVVKQTLEDLGYKVYSKVLNAKDFGVPQNRERIYIVAFLDNVDFDFPKILDKDICLGNILDKNVDKKYTISDKLWAGHQSEKFRNIIAYLSQNPREAQLKEKSGKEGNQLMMRKDGVKNVDEVNVLLNRILSN